MSVNVNPLTVLLLLTLSISQNNGLKCYECDYIEGNKEMDESCKINGVPHVSNLIECGGGGGDYDSSVKYKYACAMTHLEGYFDDVGDRLVSTSRFCVPYISEYLHPNKCVTNTIQELSKKNSDWSQFAKHIMTEGGHPNFTFTGCSCNTDACTMNYSDKLTGAETAEVYTNEASSVICHIFLVFIVGCWCFLQ